MNHTTTILSFRLPSRLRGLPSILRGAERSGVPARRLAGESGLGILDFSIPLRFSRNDNGLAVISTEVGGTKTKWRDLLDNREWGIGRFFAPLRMTE